MSRLPLTFYKTELGNAPGGLEHRQSPKNKKLLPPQNIQPKSNTILSLIMV